MKNRLPLKLNTELRFTNQDQGTISYYVGEVIGVGGTCIVYDGYYINNAGQKKTVRIKECYPYKLRILRAEDNGLVATPNQEGLFEEYKERLKNAFQVENELLEASGLSNSLSNTLDVYEYNNTVYIVSSYREGTILSSCKVKSIMDAVKLIKSTASSIHQIHKMGYLYLDIKPDNIMVLPETTELIQLFDFDSMIPIKRDGDILDYRISYSAGFAPVEQKLGDLSKVGIETDVYSIGALLYFLLFGKTPTALDCGSDAMYDFTVREDWNCYSAKVFGEISTFFHNTLRSYTGDRYCSMQAVIDQLIKIEKYADLSKPFIHSTNIPEQEFCIGRENELTLIDQWIKSDSKCLFVSGMGGIGKSTIVRQYISKYKSSFENILYIYCNESVCNAVTDDGQVFLNHCEKSKDETNAEYFLRKIAVLNSMNLDAKSILVLDDFDGIMDDDCKKLFDVGWKVIAITRKEMNGLGYPVIFIKEIADEQKLFQLFENYTKNTVIDSDFEKVKRIMTLVNNHTLSVELIAKQISRSYLTIDEALVLAQNNGFAGMGDEKIEVLKDGQRHYEKIAAFIQAIYNVSSVSECKQNIMKIVSVFDSQGIPLKELKDIAQMQTYDDVNELVESGWISISGEMISMHPLIQETINQLEWNDSCREYIICFMTQLYKFIKLNGKKNEYPRKLNERNKRLKKLMYSHPSIKKQLYKKAAKQGLAGEVYLKRIEQGGEFNSGVNPKLLYEKLRLARMILKNCTRDKVLFNETIFKELMYVTIINSSKDEEEFILKYSEILLRDHECTNPLTKIELYDYAVCVCCQRVDLETAKKYLDDAYGFVKKISNNHFWGRYYDMRMDYYEELLNGAYDTQNEQEEQLYKELLSANDKAIHYMAKSKNYTSKLLLAKYMLGKAVLLIRNNPNDATVIKNLILKSKPLVEKYTLDSSDIRSLYNMTWAWYYTLCEPDQEMVLFYLNKARTINEDSGISELDQVDNYYIPSANMMYELRDAEKAIAFLLQGIEICDSHSDIIPFIRKRKDLMSYISEVETQTNN